MRVTEHQTRLKELKDHLKSLPKLSDTTRDKRIKKAKSDFWYFIKTYFPHHIEQAKKETSDFRSFVHNNFDTLLIDQRKLLWEAYRGSAKTTTISRLGSIWLFCKGLKKYAILISSTIEVAKETVETIQLEFEENENLISDFEITQGSTWTKEDFIVKIGDLIIKMKCAGAGKKIRGANFLGSRPDLIILDDIENDENVETKAQRDKLWRWFNKAVMRLPSRTSTNYNIVCVGTRLHHDSLLARLSQRADFKSFSFPLVQEFPRELNMLSKENINDIKLTGYKLDDPRIDIRDIMIEYLEDRDSFYSELQNQPLSSDSVVFKEYQTYSSIDSFDAVYIGIDPALGKEKGDYFAIATIYRKGSHFYASAQGYKIAPGAMIGLIIAKFVELKRHEKPIKIAIETQAFQEFFKDSLKSEAKKKHIHLPIIEIKNKVQKELRIDSLSPYVNDATILIYENSHLLIDELATYPKSAHDDLLDALEMAFRVANKKAGMDYSAIEKVQKEYNFLFKKELY
jgi:predicted phage terminase large subunit-like protein